MELYQPLTEADVNRRMDKIWKTFESFEEDRKANLANLLADFEEEFKIAPASGKEFFHNAFPGGLIDHTINVISFAYTLYNLWEDSGITTNTTLEEVLFVALVHDFGKLGTIDFPYYVPVTEAWQIKRGELYELNKEMIYQHHIDGTFYLLQDYNIIISQQEQIAIKTHDGMYDKDNEKYLVKWGPHYRLNNSLPYILHQADIMAWQKEYNEFVNWTKENR